MKKIVLIFLFLLISITLSPRVHSCTAFYIAKGDTILAGNNEDWFSPKTKIWFIPAENGDFGRVYFGFDNFHPQGGMNEKGLFFDGFATELMEVVNSKDKPYFRGVLADHVMATCATVEEVIAIYSKYNLEHFRNFMLMFGDAYGKSVIIEGDDIVKKEGDHQVCTNFYLSKTKPDDIDCWRYLEVNEMLKASPDVSVELCKSILQAVHVDFTQYSNVYDLKNKKVYLYHFHNYQHVVEIDLENELKKGRQSYDLASLFPVNEEFIKRSRPKVTPINSKPILLFLVLSSTVFAATPFILYGWKKKIMKVISNGEKVVFKMFKPAQIYASVATIGLFLFLLVLSQYPEIFISGMPRQLKGLSIMHILVMHIPLLVIVLTANMIVIFFIVLRKRLWSQGLRVYYFLVFLLLLVNLGFLKYWNLIRI